LKVLKIEELVKKLHSKSLQIKFKVSKLGLEVLLKRKNHTTMVKSPKRNWVVSKHYKYSIP
jgi:hypothetical protein